MNAAFAMAQAAALVDEVPVGCVITRCGEIIAAAHNRREHKQNALAHAELIAIRLACETVGYWRLPDCSLYVTLEPCPMCAGAIVNARIGALIFGASDPKAGAVGSVCNLFDLPFNHRPVLRSGLMAGESQTLLRDFFRQKRKK